jgi:hypothetical protein
MCCQRHIRLAIFATNVGGSGCKFLRKYAEETPGSLGEEVGFNLSASGAPELGALTKFECIEKLM